MLAGLRHGRTLGTPLALVVRNRDHKNWTWGMSPWPPEGEPAGKGTKPVTLPRPGHADLAGALKYGLDDTRDALERASARHTAVIVAAGAVAKALLAAIEIEVAGRGARRGGPPAPDRRGARRARHGRRRRRGARARRPARPRLVRDADDRLDARLAAALMGIQAVKGVEIGDGFALARAARLGGARRDRRDGLRRRETNRAGGIEAGVSNGEEIVVRAAMKPLPTLMKPLRRSTSTPASRARRSSSGATSPRSRRSRSSPRPPSRSSSRARRARSSAATRSATSSAPGARTSSASRGDATR